MNSTWFVSSTGSGLSATIGGLSVIGVATVVSQLFSYFGHPLAAGSIYDLVVAAAQAVGAVYFVFGLIRKAYFQFKAPVAK